MGNIILGMFSILGSIVFGMICIIINILVSIMNIVVFLVALIFVGLGELFDAICGKKKDENEWQ